MRPKLFEINIARAGLTDYGCLSRDICIGEVAYLKLSRGEITAPEAVWMTEWLGIEAVDWWRESFTAGRREYNLMRLDEFITLGLGHETSVRWK